MSDLKARDITAYRQPMVTSLGIIMGFLLNFLAGWATRDDSVSEVKSTADWLVASTLLPSLVLMLVVLYLILDIRHKPENMVRTYVRIFRLYILSIVLVFVGVGVALFF